MFLRLEGYGDSLELAKRLVAEAGIGLAPGNAFAPESQGWLRWCFASKDPQRLVQGVDRLRHWLATAGALPSFLQESVGPGQPRIAQLGEDAA